MQNLKPKKSLGQHFLADENIASKIVGCLRGMSSGDKVVPVVEIGPGMGVLTKYLVKFFNDFAVVEIDGDAVEYLKKVFGDGLKVIHKDFLSFDFKKELGQSSFFIGNLPYNVSSPIFFHFLDNIDFVNGGVFMVQKEVADRICAMKNGTKKEIGILSVLMDCFFELKYEFKVPPGVFKPPPRVMSAVFSMKRRENVAADFSRMKKVVKTAFNQRRKTLRNSLKGIDFDESMIPEEWWTLRPEVLTTAQFVTLSEAMKDEE